MALRHPIAWPQPMDLPRSPAALGRRRVLIWIGVLVGLTLPPILIAALRTPAGSLFTGYVVIARDAFVYQALWREGWTGSWFFHSPYTTESLPGVFLYPWYLWPAHLIGWAAGPWLYQVSRVGAAIGLLVSLWQLIGELFHARVLRRWAFVLCVLGGGIGIFLPHALRIGPLTTGATEMRSPGSSVADLIAMAPHLPLAIALLCLVMLIGLRLSRRVRLSELISGCLALVALQLIYPQLALLAVLVVGSWAAVQRHHTTLWFALLGAVLQAPYLGYLLWLWLTNPETLAPIRASLDVADPFGFLVLSHLVASALIAAAIWRKRLRGDLLLPAFWIVGMTAFMFLPGLSGVVGRSFMASSIPFGLCATVGLLSLLRGIRSRAWRRRTLMLTLATSSVYGIFSLAQPYWIAGLRLDARAEYESSAEATLLQALAPRVDAADVVLTTYLDGVFVPAETNARAFVGHPDMTIDAARKSAEANAFFERWSSEQRDEFLARNGIDYVLTTDVRAASRLDGDPRLLRIAVDASGALYQVSR